MPPLRKILVIIFVIGLLTLPVVVWFSGLLPFHPLPSQPVATISLPDLISPVSSPVYISTQSATETFPVGMASAIYIMDRQSGSILYQKNAAAVRFPASTAKMMTALVARKIYPLDKVLQVKEEAFATGSSAHFRVGEQVTVQNLLYALLIPSGNDAAVILANNHPFGYERYVQEMNQLAKELDLEKSTFQNPSGLDNDQQETTARDLAILAHELMKDPVLREIVGTKEMVITDAHGKIQHRLTSTDELLGVVPGVVGIKTGTTVSAGANLITEVDREGKQVIIVLLGSGNRYNETKRIIDWVFANYQWRTIERQNQ